MKQVIINKINDYYTKSNYAYINTDVVLDEKEREGIIILPVSELSTFELKLIEDAGYHE